jgi:Thiamine pyrophosphate enzyme, N-terminal TPP binding domain
MSMPYNLAAGPLPISTEGVLLMTTVAERIVQTLRAAGVARIYGLVGDSLNGITNSLREHGEMRWIPVRHEEVPPSRRAPMLQ